VQQNGASFSDRLMKLTIFLRLFIGFTIIFLLVGAVGMYGISRLHQLSQVTRSILNDNRVINQSDNVTDALLSEIRYEKKFIFIKDNTLYGHFLLAKEDFEKNLDQVASMTDSQYLLNLVLKIKKSHGIYQALFERELDYLKQGEAYPEQTFKEEKEDAVNSAMEQLKELRVSAQQETYAKIEQLGAAGARARKVALVLTVLAVALGIIISGSITRSITHPLVVLKNKTSEIASGDFDATVDLSSPPEIKELAQAFNTMCGRLKEVDKMKSDFFSLMSHELRTPLTSLKEGTNLLLGGAVGGVNDKQTRILTIMSEESDRMIGLVNSILDLSKMEAGMMPYNFSTGDVSRLIMKAVTEIEPLCQAKNIRLETEIGPYLEKVRMDDYRILQALRNLIANAVKHTPGGGSVRVSARMIDGKVEVAVADTGMGIPAEELTVIFDKFKQTSLTNAKTLKGTGLGLALVKHIISAHGGNVWAESELGKGSIFFFVLPA
jgi:two-component system sensor histidine kinase GlrK